GEVHPVAVGGTGLLDGLVDLVVQPRDGRSSTIRIERMRGFVAQGADDEVVSWLHFPIREYLLADVDGAGGGIVVPARMVARSRKADVFERTLVGRRVHLLHQQR